MSSVQSGLAAQPRRQFVTAAAFNNDFFNYTLTTNPTTNVTTGALTANITGATAGTCPAGRILRESGLKLYPGVNNGVNTFLVGVIDSVTLLAGYIDPNSPVFAVYSTELPGFYANGVDPNPTNGLPDEGPPVYTNGNIVCVSGNISTQTGSITSAATVTATTGLGYINSAYGGNITQGTSKATTVVLNAPTGTITMNAASLATQTTVSFTFTNSFIDVSDMLVLSNTGGAVAIGCYTLNALCAAGSATVYVRNITGGALTDALVLQFIVLKG